MASPRLHKLGSGPDDENGAANKGDKLCGAYVRPTNEQGMGEVSSPYEVVSFFRSFLGVNSALDFGFCFGWLEWPGTVS